MDSTTEYLVTKEKSPISHEWTISENRLRKLRTSSAKHKQLCSNFFPVPCHNDHDGIDELLYGFHFVITDGEQNNLGKAMIKFELQNIYENYESNITFSIESAGFSVECKARHVSARNSSKAIICRIDKLFDPKKQFIVDGELIIKCEGYIIHEEVHPKLKEIDDSGLHPVQESKDLWENDNEKVCHVKVDGKLIYLHKDIFEHMFPESFHRNPVIYGFSYDAVNLAIKFNYDFRLVYPLTLEESLQIFKFMKIYGRKGIIYEFERFLIEQINESTVSRISQSAVECNDTKVKNYCFEFLMNCLRESIPISDFELIPKKMALELLEMSFTKVSYKY